MQGLAELWFLVEDTDSAPSPGCSSSALPFSVIVTLFYRVFVMYAATRVVLALKRRTGGYEDNRKLSEEEPVRPSPSLHVSAFLAHTGR